MIRPLKNHSLEANVTSRESVPLITSKAQAEGPRAQHWSRWLAGRGAYFHSIDFFGSSQPCSHFPQVTMSKTRGPVRNENMGPLLQKLRISRQRQRNIKLSAGLFETTRVLRPIKFHEQALLMSGEVGVKPTAF